LIYLIVLFAEVTTVAGATTAAATTTTTPSGTNKLSTLAAFITNIHFKI
jgi:hypothetical protein